VKPSRYGPFDYSPILDRPKLTWPNGKRIALWIAPNVEYFHLDLALAGNEAPNVPDWAVRDYGNRVAVFRLMDLLDQHGIKATACLNSDICRYHPRIIEGGARRGWEWIGHSTSNSLRPTSLSRAAQAENMAECLDTIERHTGVRPTGWLGQGMRQSWDTLDLLAEHGVKYVCDWCNDDQPYKMRLDGGNTLISIPYTVELNDFSVFTHQRRTADEFTQMICEHFDVIYREAEHTAKVMCIALHPYLVGVPHRIQSLDRALSYICKHEGVWRTTGREIYEAFLTASVAAAPNPR